MNRFPLCICWSLVLLAQSGIGNDRLTGKTFASRSEVIAKHGMAATSQPLATQIALDILKGGGNAIDAAIAANAALGLMEPTGNGIGGDLFAIVWHAETKKLYGLNASGRSPKSLTLSEFKKRSLTKIPKFGPLPVTVPGCVDGWFTLHDWFGRAPMADVLAPAIRYAKEGFPVSEVIANGWRSGETVFKDYPGFSETFLRDGRAPRKGEIFKNEALSQTLQRISDGGRDVFYQGEIADTIDQFMKRVGGFLTKEDLASHTSNWVEPVSANYRGYDLWELPPNGQGIAALQMLNVLEGYDVRGAGFGSVDHLHWLIEAKKLAFEDRAKFYADPDFNRLPTAELISKPYAKQRRALIKNVAGRSYDAGNPSLEEGDTIYLTVADKDRNMVSLIQSNYRGFGSGLCPDGLGFGLQDRGELFDLREGHFNTYAPNKRPFHTIIPAFVTKDGQPYMSFGVMGGATQPQGHVQIMLNIIDFDMNLQEAGDAARLVHTGSSQPTGEMMTNGGAVNMESGFDYATIRGLLERGHSVQFAKGIYGGYQAIRYDAEQDVYYGASEVRKDGQAGGY
ncbi:MAG: gamma-glutamyltranspeptidase/glutathione hydrolase [Verrucomicrobiales bacterium]|jgi:gamma-glutamyltranspeptidase/glutathione hydrolase